MPDFPAAPQPPAPGAPAADLEAYELALAEYDDAVVLLAARLSHTLRREIQLIGGEPQIMPAWEEALADPACAWMITDSIASARAFLSGSSASPREEHDRWMADRERQGYVRGPVKNTDPAAGPLTHPLLVPYSELSVLQRLKDAVTVGALTATGQVLLLSPATISAL
jgi:hypothetical protein